MAGPEELFSAMPDVKVVQLLSAGVERWLPHLPDGVTLCNGRGVHGPATAELAVAGILAIIRQLPMFLAEQAAHRWTEVHTEDLDGKRVLVLGAGDIAHPHRATHSRCSAPRPRSSRAPPATGYAASTSCRTCCRTPTSSRSRCR